jgi:hypothetical protein
VEILPEEKTEDDEEDDEESGFKFRKHSNQ